MADAFFIPEGGAYVSQPWTRGPWSNDHQHGGPPAALIAFEMERALGEALPQWQPARFLMELLKPVPIAPLQVQVSVARDGKRVKTLKARLEVQGTTIVQAECVFVRRAEVPTPETSRSPQRLPTFEGVAPTVLGFFQHDVGYHTAMEIRLPREPWGGRTCAAWMRPRFPIVLGHTPTPLQRVVLACDASSGIAPPLPLTTHTFLNPELVVHLWRDLVGDFVGLDAFSEVGASGLGVARSTVYDLHGSFASSAQALLVEARAEGAR